LEFAGAPGVEIEAEHGAHLAEKSLRDNVEFQPPTG
jgi:hypothetical protein